MKTSLKIPLALSLAAVPFWCGQAFAQENAAPPEPAPSPQAEVKVQTPDSNEDTDEPAQTVISRDGSPRRVNTPGKEGDKRQKVTFLGVGTSPLPEAVAAQLPLEKGTGLLVMFVAKDSPAEKAGLAPNDVLVKLDEHILVNAAQLQTVIENRKEGDPAKLVFYRKGQEKTASATLASQEKFSGRHGTNWGDWGDWGDASHTAEFQAALARVQEAAERGRQAAERGRQEAELGKQAAELGKQAAERGRREAESIRSEIEKQKGDWAMSIASLQEALKGIDLPSDGLTTTFTKPGSAQTLTVDHEGIFLLTRKENTLHLRVTDKAGKVRFDADVTTPQERSKVPPELEPKLQKLLKDFPADTDPSAPPVPPAPPAAPVPPAPVAPTPPGF